MESNKTASDAEPLFFLVIYYVKLFYFDDEILYDRYTFLIITLTYIQIIYSYSFKTC